MMHGTLPRVIDALTTLHSTLDAQLANTRSYDMHTVEV